VHRNISRRVLTPWPIDLHTIDLDVDAKHQINSVLQGLDNHVRCRAVRTAIIYHDDVQVLPETITIGGLLIELMPQHHGIVIVRVDQRYLLHALGPTK